MFIESVKFYDFCGKLCIINITVFVEEARRREHGIFG